MKASSSDSYYKFPQTVLRIYSLVHGGQRVDSCFFWYVSLHCILPFYFKMQIGWFIFYPWCQPRKRNLNSVMYLHYWACALIHWVVQKWSPPPHHHPTQTTMDFNGFSIVFWATVLSWLFPLLSIPPSYLLPVTLQILLSSQSHLSSPSLLPCSSPDLTGFQPKRALSIVFIECYFWVIYLYCILSTQTSLNH